MVKTFVFMGLPGSGKGKQAELLSKRSGFPIFSTGGEFRRISAEDSFVGKRVRETIDAGNLMPSWFASYLFERSLFDIEEGDGIIFEGVGRKEPEARLFDEICTWLGRDYRIIHSKVSEKSVIERLRKRQLVEGRHDDDPSVYQNRLKNFYEHTAPALEFFRSVGKVVEVDGEPLPDIIAQDIWDKVSLLWLESNQEKK